MANEPLTIWTIGHGNAEIDDLRALLRRFEIPLLVDVRSTPYSRYAPQFNRETLEVALRSAGLHYLFCGQKLGGRPANASLQLPDGKPDYLQMAKTAQFRAGVEEVIAAGRTSRVCLLCSEEDPVACHRSLLIAGQLHQHNCQVIHIRHDGTTETDEAVTRRRTGGQLALF